MKIPFLYTRHLRGVGTIYIVKLASYTDQVLYDAQWMRDPVMGSSGDYGSDDYVTVPGLDIREATFVFDNGDPELARREALAKMKELWAAVNIEEN